MPLIESVLPSQFGVMHLVRRSSASSLPFPILYPTLRLCQSYSFDLSSLSCSCFMSLMRESLFPSFDKSILIDFSISSGTQTENIFSTLELTCLNGGYPRFWQWVYIIDPWSENSTNLQLQLLYSHIVGMYYCTLKIIIIIGDFARTC